MMSYQEAWYAVSKDLRSKVTVVPVPLEMPDEAPHTVEEALLMCDVLDRQIALTTMRMRCRMEEFHHQALLASIRNLLRYLSIQQRYLNKAENLLILGGNSPDERVMERQAFVQQERDLAVVFLEKLKEMAACFD